MSGNINQARALYYNTFGILLLDNLLKDNIKLLESNLKILSSNPLEDSTTQDFKLLLDELEHNGAKNFLEEYTNMFILPFSQSDKDIPTKSKKGKGKPPRYNPQVYLYLSHYTHGCINGESLVLAKRIVKKSTKRLDREIFKESEEHLGFLFIFMESMLSLGEDALAKECFKELISPMVFKVIDGILNREDSALYGSVARILKAFMDIESMGNK